MFSLKNSYFPRAVAALCLAALLVGAPGFAAAAEYKKLIMAIAPDNEVAYGFCSAVGTVVLGGRLYVIGGDENEGITSTADLVHWRKDSRMNALDVIGHAVAAFKDRMWVIGGGGLDGYLSRSWSSGDGGHWSQSPSDLPFGPRTGHALVVYKDRMWLLGGSGKELDNFSDVWCSSDGESWRLVTDKAAFGRRHRHAGLVFGGKMWIIGGNLDSAPDDFSPQVWSSADGENWQLVTADAGFRPNDGVIKAAVFDGRMWVFSWNKKGLLLWHSVDGRNWTVLSPDPTVDEEVQSIIEFRGDLLFFIYEGIMKLE